MRRGHFLLIKFLMVFFLFSLLFIFPVKRIKAESGRGKCISSKSVGDANGDCKVDNLDFGIWKGNYGSLYTENSDFNSDGKIDLIDFEVWREESNRHTPTEDEFLSLSTQREDYKVIVKNEHMGVLKPIWQAVDVHTLETFFSKHLDKKPYRWLHKIFPYFKYARITSSFGSVNPCIVKKRSGEEYQPIFRRDDKQQIYYKFSQFDHWLDNLLQSGLYPEFIIKGVAPDKYFLGDNLFHINSYNTYTAAQSVAAPPDAGTDRHFIKYVDDIYDHLIQTYGSNRVSYFHWFFWHEPWVTYNPLPGTQTDNPPGCDDITNAGQLQGRCDFNRRFDKYYQLYKMYYDDSLKRFGQVKAVPVFSITTQEERQHYFGNDNYWFKAFIERANADGLKLPYIAINPYYHIRYINSHKVYHLEESLREIKNILKGTRYEHLPIYATEVSVQHDITEYGASGLAYLYDLFDKNGIVEMNTWLVHNYFSYNYWAGDYQDPTKWIKVPTTNVWAMLQRMENQPELKIELERELGLEKKVPRDAKINARVTRENGVVRIWGYYFIGGRDDPSLRNNPDSISQLHKPVDIRFNLSDLGLDSSIYTVKSYVIDHKHSNFWPYFKKLHPELHLSYFPQKGEYYNDKVCKGGTCCRDCKTCSPSHNQGEPKFQLSSNDIEYLQEHDDLQLAETMDVSKNDIKNSMVIKLSPWSVFLVEIVPTR